MRLRMIVRDLSRGVYHFLISAQVLFWFYLCFGNYAPHVNTERGQLEPVHIQELRMIENETADTSLNETDIMMRYYNPFLKHTIFPRDPSVVLEGSFLRNPANLCMKHEDLDLVVLVHTSPYNFGRRNLLRDTFMQQLKETPYTTQLVFMIGTHNATKFDPEAERSLKEENERFHDIVQLDFNENFRNLTLKALMWMRWMHENCHNTKMILKIDDDVILDLRRILPLSTGYFSKFKRSIFCHVNKQGTQPIPRIGRTKVDPREFFKVEIYPYTYCSGFIVFLSPDMIQLLMTAAIKTPLYNVDDVFMFGILPKVAGEITYHNIGFNVSVWNQKVLNCSLARGLACPYYGTMHEKEEGAKQVGSAFEAAHRNEFVIPRITVH